MFERGLRRFPAALLRDQRQLLVYLAIGVSGASLDFLVFFVLHDKLGLALLVANTISVSLGITNNFILNAVFNFRTRDNIVARFASFYAVGLTGLILSALILEFLVHAFELRPIVAKLASTCIVVVIQYNLNRLVTFRTGRVTASERLPVQP